MNNFIDFPSRISVRGVVAGMLTTFASMILLMMIAAGSGLWRYDLTEVPDLGTGFWVFMFAAWTISLGFGAFVSSISGRSSTRLDGILHGVVTWAGACVLGCLSLGVASGRLFNFASMQHPAGIFWLALVGDTLALLVAHWAGAAGARTEASSRGQERFEKRVA